MALREIKKADIATIEAIALSDKAQVGRYDKSRPVFKVIFKNGDDLIVKAELGGDKAAVKKSMEFGAMIMEAVSPEVKAERLKDAEVTALQEVPESLYLPANRKSLAHSYLNDVSGNTRLFFLMKMAVVGNLRTAEQKLNKKSDDETDEKQAERAKKLVGKLSTSQAMEALGRIIAADFFIGNHDRFAKNGEVVNIGNIMFEKLADKSYKPVGLDFLDPNGKLSNIAQSVDLKKWGGHQLKDRVSIGELAVKIIRGINDRIEEMVPGIKRSELLDQTKCGGPLISGLQAGCEAIKARIKVEDDAGRAVAGGVRQRMDALGW